MNVVSDHLPARCGSHFLTASDFAARLNLVARSRDDAKDPDDCELVHLYQLVA